MKKFVVSLDRFYGGKNIFCVKQPRLVAIFPVENGKQNVRKQTVRKPNFETFCFQMDLEFECSEFEPRLYSGHYLNMGPDLLQIV